MTDLIVGLDGVAVARDLRRSAEPDPASFAMMAEIGGAAGVSLGLRADRRQSLERDAKVLRATVKTRLQLRIAPTPDAVKTVAPIRPDLVVLVPERTDAAGHEAPFDLNLSGGPVSEAAASLKEAGLDALALVEADVEQVKLAHRAGVRGVSILGARVTTARLPEPEERELEALDRAVKLAARLGLLVQVAHGLDMRSGALVARLPGVGAVEIGHALVARAALLGADRATRDFLSALRG